MDKRICRGMGLKQACFLAGVLLIVFAGLNDTARNAIFGGNCPSFSSLFNSVDPFNVPSIRAYLSQSGTRITSFDIANCSDHLGPYPADDLAKIDSYNFSSVQEYMSELFPPLLEEPTPPKIPVFVTAFSSNHFTEGMVLLRNLNETVRMKYKDVKIILYDIGLSTADRNTLNVSCACELRKFEFSHFPKHVKNRQNYAWKAISIQMVAVEHPFVVWVDASVRFKTGNLDQLFEEVKQKGIMAHDISATGIATIPERTHENTFKFLHENPCTFAFKAEYHSGLVFIFANKFILRYFLRPWVACALSFGCMDPVPNSRRFLPCPVNRKMHKYHLCHRFDQSILGILVTRLFHRQLTEHFVDTKYFMFCRSVVVSKASCVYYD